MIKFIVWDVDGTLYKNVPFISQFLKNSYENQLADFWKIPFPKLKKLFEKRRDVYKSTTLALASLINTQPSKLNTAIYEKYPLKKHLKKDVRLINLFKRLKHLNHFALRNGSSKRTKAVITALGLGKIKKAEAELGPFTKVWGSLSLSGTTKPNRLVFDMVRTYLYYHYDNSHRFPNLVKLTEKEIFQFSQQILIVGDRPEVDLKPAKTLGFKTALVWTNKDPKFPYIDYVFKTVYEIKNIFKNK